MRDTANAPLCGDGAPAGAGGPRGVAPKLVPGDEHRVVAPGHRADAQAVAAVDDRAAPRRWRAPRARVRCMLLDEAAVPAFSSRPPGITMTLSALRCSTTSISASGTCAAATLRTSRSTGAGSERDGRHAAGTRRSRALPGLTTKTARRSNPSRRTLSRMMRPGFISRRHAEDGDRPRRAAGSSASRTGRGVRARHAAVADASTSTSSATSSPPQRDERVDLEVGDAVGTAGRRQPAELLDRLAQAGDAGAGGLAAHAAGGQRREREPQQRQPRFPRASSGAGRRSRHRVRA